MIFSYEFDGADLKSMGETFKKKPELYKDPVRRGRYRDTFISKLNNEKFNLKGSTLIWRGNYYICDFTNNDPAIEKAQIKRFIEEYEKYPDGIIFKRTGHKDDQSFGLIEWDDFKNAYKIDNTLDDGKQSYRLRNRTSGDTSEIRKLQEGKRIKDFDEVLNGRK